MMIGKRTLAHDVEPARTEGPKEALGIANAREGEQRPPGQRCDHLGVRLQMRSENRLSRCGDAGCDRLTSGAAADHDQRISARELRRQGRVQRSGWRHPAVADPRAPSITINARSLVSDGF